MARNVAFRQADVTRAVKGASKAGMDIGSMEIDPTSGRIILIAKSESVEPLNAFDKWEREKNAGRA